MVTPKIASLFSIFIGITRFGNQLATRSEQAFPASPHSFLSFAIPTLSTHAQALHTTSYMSQRYTNFQ